jgi:hypothetical protein
MEPVITLYDCPPLRARITACQCALNRSRAAQPSAPRRLHKARDDVKRSPGHRECANCPGVQWYAQQRGAAPRKLRASDIIAAHLKGDEIRRRTSAVPERNSYSLRREDVASLLGLSGSSL